MKEKKLPEGWVWAQLKDLTVKVETTNPENTPNDEFIYLDIDAIDNSQQKITNPKKFLGSEAPSRARQMVKTGDILFSTVRIYLKNIAFVEQDYNNQIASTGFCVIRLKENVENKFVFHYVQTQDFLKKLELFQRGANYPAVRDSDILTQYIPLPPLPVQRQIVAVLEQAEALKRQRQEADALTGALLQSVFYEMFGDPVRNEKGWKKAKVSDITLFHKQGLYTDVNYAAEGIRLIRITDITENGNLSYSSMPFLSINDKIAEQFKVEQGDFLFARSGVSIGRCAIVEANIPCVFGSFIIKFQFDPTKIDNKFFLYLMRMPINQYQLKKFTHGSANPNVNADNIKGLDIMLPPLTLQQQFARIVEEVERFRGKQAESGKEIEALCGGLMQRAFAGELSTGKA